MEREREVEMEVGREVVMEVVMMNLFGSLGEDMRKISTHILTYEDLGKKSTQVW